METEDFNKKHPEMMEDEVYISNMTPRDFYECSWETKRGGNQAYEINGCPLKCGTFPVFIKRREVIERGLNLDAFI